MSENNRNKKMIGELLLNGVNNNSKRSGSISQNQLEEVKNGQNKQINNYFNHTSSQHFNLHLQQIVPISLPVTHHKFGEQNGEIHDGIGYQYENLSISGDDMEQMLKSRVSLQENKNVRCEKQIENNYQLLLANLVQIQQKYNQILINTKQNNKYLNNQQVQSSIILLYSLFKQCLDIKLFNKNFKCQKSYTLADVRKKQVQLEFVVLLMDICLNLWKLVVQKNVNIEELDQINEAFMEVTKCHGASKPQNRRAPKKSPTQQLTPLQIVSKGSLKILSVLNILNRTTSKKSQQIHIDKDSIQKYRIFIILPQTLKNRLILLIILWAKQQLINGNPTKSLQICNIISYQLVYISNIFIINKNIIQIQKNIKNYHVIITKQNQFKLHYLRIKIFQILYQFREELEEIFICQQLIKNIKNNHHRKDNYQFYNANNANNKINKQKIQKQYHPNKFQQQNIQTNYQNIQKYLQKRKQQLLQKIQQKYKNRQNDSHNKQITSYDNNNNNNNNNYKNIFDNQQNNSIGSYSRSLKQVRDSIKISQDYQKQSTRFIANYQQYTINKLNKSKSITPGHVNYVRKPYQINSKRTQVKRNSFTQNLMRININQGYFNTNTINRPSQQISQTKNKIKQFSISKTKSLSLLNKNKCQKQQIKNKNVVLNNNNKNKNNNINIQQKFQLKTKKLVKKSIKTNQKNLQYLNVLSQLQKQVNDNNNQNIPFHHNYEQMLLKRPKIYHQNNQISNMYMKNCKNMMQNPTIYREQSNCTQYIDCEQSQSDLKQKNPGISIPPSGINPTNSQKIQQCVQLVEMQVIERYIARIFSLQILQRKIKKGSQQNIQDNQSDHFLDTDSCDQIIQSKIKYRQKQKQKDSNKFQQKFKNQLLQSAFQIYYHHILFPLIGRCQEIYVNVKKIKYIGDIDDSYQNYQEDTKNKYAYMMTIIIKTQSGIYYLDHKIPHTDLLSKNSLLSNIIKNIQEYIRKQNKQKNEGIKLNIFKKGQTTQQQKQQKIKNQLLIYIKTNIIIINKGLGLQFKFKQLEFDFINNKYNKYHKYNKSLSNCQIQLIDLYLFQNMWYFNQIYQDFQQSLISLFSQGNRFHLEHLINFNNGIQNNKNVGYNKQIKNVAHRNQSSVMSKLKILYVVIQKKQKKQKKKQKKSPQNLIPPSRKLIQKKLNNQQLIMTISQQKHNELQNKQIKQNLIKNTISFDKIKQISQNKQQYKQLFNQSSYQLFIDKQNLIYNQYQIDKIRTIVFKSLILNYTYKPKYKLKIIINKINQFNNIRNHFYQQQQHSLKYHKKIDKNRKFSKQFQHQVSIVSKYPKQQHVTTTQHIFTQIYSEIIQQYFMDVWKRNNPIQSKIEENAQKRIGDLKNDTQLSRNELTPALLSNQNEENLKKSNGKANLPLISKIQKAQNVMTIPEDVITSLKYYLMISNHFPIFSKNSKPNGLPPHHPFQAQNLPYIQNINIIQQFFEKYQYSYISTLNSNNQISPKKTYIINITYYHIKKLYRLGLDKFYMIKFQINQKNARTRLDKFILNYYDICKYFHGMEILLNNYINCQDMLQEDSQMLQQQDKIQNNNTNNKLISSNINQTQSYLNTKYYDSIQASSNYSNITNNKQQQNNQKYLQKNSTLQQINYELLYKKISGTQSEQFNQIKSNNIFDATYYQKLSTKNIKSDHQIDDIKCSNQSLEIHSANKQNNHQYGRQDYKIDKNIQTHQDINDNKQIDNQLSSPPLNSNQQPEIKKQLQPQQPDINNNNQTKIPNQQQLQNHQKTLKDLLQLQPQTNTLQQDKNKLVTFLKSSRINSTIPHHGQSINNGINNFIYNHQAMGCFNEKNYQNTNVKINLKYNLYPKNDICSHNTTNSNIKQITQLGKNPILNQSINRLKNTSSLTNNRLSCPLNKIRMKQLTIKSCNAAASGFMVSTRKSQASQKNMINKKKNILCQQQREKKNQNQVIHEDYDQLIEYGSRNIKGIADEVNNYQINVISQQKNRKNGKPSNIYDNNRSNIVECLKKITQKISIYKTKIYTRIGIQFISNKLPPHISQFPNKQLSQIDEITDKKQKTRYYSNRYKIFRNEYRQNNKQFLQPYLKQLQIIYKKIIKISCDDIFAILTIFNIKSTTQFYIKIYLPNHQKTMAFTITHRVFLYFNKEQLKEIFQSIIQFDYHNDKKNKHVNKGNQHKYAKFDGKKVKDQKYMGSNKVREKDRDNQQKYMIDKIQKFFTNKQQTEKRDMKAVQQQNNANKINQQNQQQKYKLAIPQQQLPLSIEPNNKQAQNSNIKQLLEEQHNKNEQIIEKQIQNIDSKSDEIAQNKINNKKQQQKYLSHEQKMKKIWSRILKYLKFQRKSNNYSFQVQQYSNGIYNRSYLIAKLGTYQGFIKDFSVQDYICIDKTYGQKNSNRITNKDENKNMIQQWCKILKIQISMQQKVDGLNYLNRDMISQIKAKKCRVQKRNLTYHIQSKFSHKNNKQVYSHNQFVDKTKPYIYKSQANKQIIYVAISDAKTGEKICYSYYLCELLHLLDNKNIKTKNNQINIKRIQSKQFKQILLNYAILYKILNYIKNQYFIQLQKHSQYYYGKLFQHDSIKQELKNNVDLMLVGNYYKNLNKPKAYNQQKQQHDQQQQLEKRLKSPISPDRRIKKSLTSKASFKKNCSSIQQNTPNNRIQNSYRLQKITFNSTIINQKYENLVFLIRKVIRRKGYPIWCVFYNRIQSKLVIYLTNYKNGVIKEIQVPIALHSMPFIYIAAKKYEESKRSNWQARSAKNDNIFLSFRRRLLRHHHNMTLLAQV